MSKDMASKGYYNCTPMFVGVGGTDPAVKDIVPSSTEAESLAGGQILLYVSDPLDPLRTPLTKRRSADHDEAVQVVPFELGGWGTAHYCTISATGNNKVCIYLLPNLFKNVILRIILAVLPLPETGDPMIKPSIFPHPATFHLIIYPPSQIAIRSSVVGYTTMNAPVGSYVMVGGQFTSTLGQPVNLQDFVKGSFTPVDWDEAGVFWSTSAVTLIYNGVDFDWYYYINDAQATGDSPAGWVNFAGDYVADVTIKPGEGFWFGDFNAADGKSVTITFAGQIPGDENGYTLTTTGSAYNMIANPLPIEMPINSEKITWENLAAVDWDEAGEFWATAPVVLLYNGTDFDWYYYIHDAAATGESPDGFVTFAGDIASDAKFKIMEGCWFRDPAGATVNIKFAR